MNEKREILGLWWLPTDPKERWTGTLTLEPGKSPRLTVIVPKGLFRLDGRKAPPVLHGRDDQDNPITLLFPAWSQAEGGTAMTRVSFTAGYAVVGMELASAKDFAINTVTVGLQHLYEWAGLSGFGRDEHTSTCDFSVRYQRPHDHCFEIDADLSIELRAAPSFREGPREKVVREDTCVGFRSRKALNLSKWIELLNGVRQLLHFAVLKPVYPLWITGGKDGYGETIQGHFIPHDIEIWHSIIRERVESEFPAGRWVFQFADVQTRFAPFLAKWLAFCRDFDEPLRCYSTTVYHRLPSEVAHLCLSQALEAYHGRKHGKHPFAARIRMLAQSFLPYLKGLVSDAASFAEEVRDNRNYYTHHDPAIQRNGRVVSGGKLYRLNEKLRLLFQMCVLAEMGIPSDRFPRLSRQLATDIIEWA